MDAQKVIAAAAKAAQAQWNLASFKDVDELVQDLWVWYLESPATQKKLENADPDLRHFLVKKAAFQLLSRMALSGDLAGNKSTYSGESVKAALAGKSTNKYLFSILGDAVDKLGYGYAEAIRVRYTDGVVPEQGAPAVKLSRAIRALTQEVNLMMITSQMTKDENGMLRNVEGPGRRKGSGYRGAADASARRPQGVHNDPTAGAAMLLMDHPELRDEYFLESSWEEFFGGRNATHI